MLALLLSSESSVAELHDNKNALLFHLSFRSLLAWFSFQSGMRAVLHKFTISFGNRITPSESHGTSTLSRRYSFPNRTVHMHSWILQIFGVQETARRISIVKIERPLQQPARIRFVKRRPSTFARPAPLCLLNPCQKDLQPPCAL